MAAAVPAAWPTAIAKRNLERPGVDVHRVALAGARVQVDPACPDPHAVEEGLGRGRAGAGLHADVLLEDGEFGGDAAAFAVVGLLGEAIRRAKHVAPQAQSPIAVAAVVPRRVALHPVEEGQAELAGLFQRALGLRRRNARLPAGA